MKTKFSFIQELVERINNFLYPCKTIQPIKLPFNDKSKSAREMQKSHELITNVFCDDIELVSYYGPVQMGVFGLECKYLQKNYLISFETERGIITLRTTNKKNSVFYPSMIYKEADYYHPTDSEIDIKQLVDLTYKAIKENKIVFKSF